MFRFEAEQIVDLLDTNKCKVKVSVNKVTYYHRKVSWMLRYYDQLIALSNNLLGLTTTQNVHDQIILDQIIGLWD